MIVFRLTPQVEKRLMKALFDNPSGTILVATDDGELIARGFDKPVESSVRITDGGSRAA